MITRLTSSPVHVGAGRPAGQRGVARSAVEEGSGSRTCAANRRSQRIGGHFVIAGVVGITDHDDTVIRRSGSRRYLPPLHVLHDGERITFERITPPAATGGSDANHRAGR